MITAIFKQKYNRKYELLMYGHANFDNHGKDIVCSAVSSLTTAVINEIINEGLNLNMTKEFYPLEDNKLHIELIGMRRDISKEYEVKLLNMLKTNLKEIEKQYPENISVIVDV